MASETQKRQNGMEKGCFGLGVITSFRAKIGGKDKGKSDAYIKSVDPGFDSRLERHTRANKHEVGRLIILDLPIFKKISGSIWK